MDMKRALLLLILFIFVTLSADDGLEISKATDLLSSEETPLAAIDGIPSTMILQCVNVITGTFQDHEVDIVMSGADPLYFERFYSSSDNRDNLLFHGWNHNMGGGLSQQYGSRHNYAVTKGLSGGEYVYKGSGKKMMDKILKLIQNNYRKDGPIVAPEICLEGRMSKITTCILKISKDAVM
jgi:Domain of unknown function (DUF6531)